MSDPLRLGIAGLGTVGGGLLRILQDDPAALAARAGRPVTVAAVSARSRGKDRGVPIDAYGWEDDPVALARRADVDLLVELIGGEDGPAKAAVETALALGKPVVTANKALLAHHGQALAEAAETAGVPLRFEAAVAGGIPCIKALGEGLAGNRMTRVMGVLNGTCNHILTQMEATRRGYNALFDEAHRLGYLEADPALDVGGIDAGHKLAILAALAFGSRVDFAAVRLTGIERVTLDDIDRAADMGYRIKLLGIAQMTEAGLEQRVEPCLVPAASPLGQLEGPTNMVVAEGDPVGQIVLRGAGAGAGPTASAVIGDILDIARGLRMPAFGLPADALATPPTAAAPGPAPYYLRFALTDRPGALAEVAASLGAAGVSIDRMRQYSHAEPVAPVLIVTHAAAPAALSAALDAIAGQEAVAAAPVALRIEAV
jgi:homoserine dehydrogenase